MSATPKNLYTKAMDLDIRDRTDLVAMLLESLDHGSDEGVEAAWIEETKRRLDAIDSGQVKPVPWSEARSRIFSRSAG
jgi:putative addiction module component (TIGR02574 family)